MKQIFFKYLLWVIIIIIAVAGGYLVYPKLHKNDANSNVFDKKDNKTYYFSFNGDYSYLVPDDYSINEGVISNGQVVTKTGNAVKTNSVEDIYEGGGIAVQTFMPFNKDKQTFQNYVNNIFKSEVEKSLNAATDVKFETKDKIDTATLKTASDGKLTRIQYLYNEDPAVLVASGDENDAFETIFSSLRSSSKRIDDYDSLRSTAIAFTYLIKNKMFDDIYRLSTNSFKEKISFSDLEKSFEKASKVLELSASTNGGSLKNGEFTLAMILTKTGENQAPKSAMAYIVFQKEDNVWKISGITLPTDEAFFGPNS